MRAEGGLFVVGRHARQCELMHSSGQAAEICRNRPQPFLLPELGDSCLYDDRFQLKVGFSSHHLVQSEKPAAGRH